jgi:hypothetical protein
MEPPTDITDLLALLGAWGPCPSPCPPVCAADLNGDCTVGMPDLLILLPFWDCPGFGEAFPASAQQCLDRYLPEAQRAAACIAALELTGD